MVGVKLKNLPLVFDILSLVGHSILATSVELESCKYTYLFKRLYNVHIYIHINWLVIW